MKKSSIVGEFGLRIECEEADGQERVIRVIGRAQVHPRPAYSLAVGSLGEDQTCSLVSRSDQRCGRINVPKAAMAQIVARSRKLAKRKNPLFMSCTESGPMTSPPYNDLIVPLHSACQPHPQRHDSSGDFFLRREEQ